MTIWSGGNENITQERHQMKKGILQAKINNLLQIRHLTKDPHVIMGLEKEIQQLKLQIRKLN